MRESTICGKKVYIPEGWTNAEYVLWCKEWDDLRTQILSILKKAGKDIPLVPKERGM